MPAGRVPRRRAAATAAASVGDASATGLCLRIYNQFQLVKPQRIHDMRTIAINGPGVCQSVSLSVTRAGCAKHLFGVETPGDPRN